MEDHPDLEQIIREAGIKISKEEEDAMLEDFKRVEAGLFEEAGDPDGLGEIYSVWAESDSEGEGGLLHLDLVAKTNDVYEALASPILGILLNEDRNGEAVGMALRIGGYVRDPSKKRKYKGNRISDDPDGEAVVTVMLSGSHILSAVRPVKVIDREPAYEITPLEKWKSDHSPLVDALVMCYLAPKFVKNRYPLIYEGMVKEMKEHLRKQEEDSE